MASLFSSNSLPKYYYPRNYTNYKKSSRPNGPFPLRTSSSSQRKATCYTNPPGHTSMVECMAYIKYGVTSLLPLLFLISQIALCVSNMQLSLVFLLFCFSHVALSAILTYDFQVYPPLLSSLVTTPPPLVLPYLLPTSLPLLPSLLPTPLLPLPYSLLYCSTCSSYCHLPLSRLSSSHSLPLQISWIDANPDGVPRKVIGINGKFPGPTINATIGDTLIVNVTNIDIVNGTGLHWHGSVANFSICSFSLMKSQDSTREERLSWTEHHG